MLENLVVLRPAGLALTRAGWLWALLPGLVALSWLPSLRLFGYSSSLGLVAQFAGLLTVRPLPADLGPACPGPVGPGPQADLRR
jgi:hypothetical protein